MFHLKDVNRILVLAGREPVLDRATEVTPPTGPAIPLGPMTAEQFRNFPAREQALATALDRRYDRLKVAASSPTPPFTGDLLDELQFLLNFVSGEGSDHASQAVTVAANLTGLQPQAYLLVTGTQPADEVDRRLVALSEEFYGSLLVILRQHFVDGALRQQAVSRMEELDKVNGILGLRGLLPPFSLSGG
jgi:hypothetical protein